MSGVLFLAVYCLKNFIKSYFNEKSTETQKRQSSAQLCLTVGLGIEPGFGAQAGESFWQNHYPVSLDPERIFLKQKFPLVKMRGDG